RIRFIFRNHVRTRSNDRHIAFQHIEKLRQFVQTCFSKNFPQFGNTRIISFSWFPIVFLIRSHGSKFQAIKFLPVYSISFLCEENGTSLRKRNCNCQNRKKPPEKCSEN